MRTAFGRWRMIWQAFLKGNEMLRLSKRIFGIEIKPQKVSPKEEKEREKAEEERKKKDDRGFDPNSKKKLNDLAPAGEFEVSGKPVKTPIGKAMAEILKGKPAGMLISFVAEIAKNSWSKPDDKNKRPPLETHEIETGISKLEKKSDWDEEAVYWKNTFEEHGEEAANAKFISLISQKGKGYSERLKKDKGKHQISLNAPRGPGQEGQVGEGVAAPNAAVEDQAQQNLFSDPAKIKLLQQIVPKMEQMMKVSVPKELADIKFDSDKYLLELVGYDKESWAKMAATVSKNVDACSADPEHGKACMLAYQELLTKIPLMRRMIGERSQGAKDNRIKLFFKHIEPHLTEDQKGSHSAMQEPFHKWEDNAGTLRKKRSDLNKELMAKHKDDPAAQEKITKVLSDLQKHLNSVQTGKNVNKDLTATKILSQLSDLGLSQEEISDLQKHEDAFKDMKQKGHHEHYKSGYKLTNKFKIKDYLADLKNNAEEFKALLNQIKTAYDHCLRMVRRAMLGLSHRSYK